MSVESKNSILAAAILAVTCLSCVADPGYELNPVGWARDSDNGWSKDIGGFVLHTRGIRGLIGESWIDPEFIVHENSQPIGIRGALLRSQDREFAPRDLGSGT